MKILTLPKELTLHFRWSLSETLFLDELTRTPGFIRNSKHASAVPVLHVDDAIHSSVNMTFIFTYASLRARSSHRQVTINHCSVYHASLAHCLLCFFSYRGPFVVRIALTFTVVKFHSTLRPSRRSQPPKQIVCFCYWFLHLNFRLASFPHLHNFFDLSTRLTVRSPS